MQWVSPTVISESSPITRRYIYLYSTIDWLHILKIFNFNTYEVLKYSQYILLYTIISQLLQALT